jgi:hypothetical protein
VTRILKAKTRFEPNAGANDTKSETIQGFARLGAAAGQGVSGFLLVIVALFPTSPPDLYLTTVVPATVTSLLIVGIFWKFRMFVPALAGAFAGMALFALLFALGGLTTGCPAC